MIPAADVRRQAAAVIAEHANEIAESWREAVRSDQRIAGDQNLPDLLLTNQVPALLSDIGQALTDAENAGSDAALERRRRGMRFGKLRGLARYDAAELYREFQHLRHAVWQALRQYTEWGRGDAFEVMLAIDHYLDEVIGASLRGFFEAADRVSGATPRYSGDFPLHKDPPAPPAAAPNPSPTSPEPGESARPKGPAIAGLPKPKSGGEPGIVSDGT